MKLVLQIALGIILAPFVLAFGLGSLLFAPKVVALVVVAVFLAWLIQGHRSQGIRDTFARIWG